MLAHPVFRAKIREWLKVMRKANCAVILGDGGPVRCLALAHPRDVLLIEIMPDENLPAE